MLYLSPFLCSLAWQMDPLHVWDWSTALRGEPAFPLLTWIRDPWCRVWCCLLCALEGEQEEVVQARKESRAATPQCSQVFDVFVAPSSVGSRGALVVFCVMALVALQVLHFWGWSWLCLTGSILPALLQRVFTFGPQLLLPWSRTKVTPLAAQQRRNMCMRGCLGGSCLPAITFCPSQDFNYTDTAPLKKSDFKLTAKLINLQRHAERKVPQWRVAMCQADLSKYFMNVRGMFVEVILVCVKPSKCCLA